MTERNTSTGSNCLPTETLSAWLDDELEADAALATRRHVETCTTCRDQALGWVQFVRESRMPATAAGAKTDACLDAETLAAYSEAELGDHEAVAVEGHLRTCTHCVAEVQRLVQLRLALAQVPPAEQLAAPTPAARALAPLTAGRLARMRGALQSIGSVLARPWPATGLVAAAAVVLLVIGRMLPMGGESDGVRLRGGSDVVRVEVTTAGAAAHSRPGEEQPVIATLPRGTAGTRLDQQHDWTRIELEDGRRVWVRTVDVAQVTATP